MRRASSIVGRIPVIAVLLVVAPAQAWATPFLPGETKAIGEGGFGGTVIEDVLRPFLIDLGGGEFIAGNFQDRIVDGDDGRIGFVSYLRDITGSPGAVIESFSRSSFPGSVDVTWSSTSIGSVAPTSGSRSADGSTMTFLFSPGIPLSPGGLLGGNEHITIAVDPTAYAEIGELVIFARSAAGTLGSISLTAFAPVAVPEPGTLSLLAAGLATVGAARRRRARRCA